MNTKIKELTENIYNEGIAKAREEADIIISEARNKAEKILSEAAEKAKTDIDNARAESEIILDEVKLELKEVYQQALELTRQELKNAVTAKISSSLAKTAASDQELLRIILSEIVKTWQKNGLNGNNPELLISEDTDNKIKALVEAKTAAILAPGIKVKPVPEVKNGFVVTENNQGVRLSFTEEDFTAFFEAIIKPRIRRHLF